jgi:hypothetical protein
MWRRLKQLMQEWHFERSGARDNWSSPPPSKWRNE